MTKDFLQLKKDAPYSSSGVYLEKTKSKEPIAACSSDKIAKTIASILNSTFIPSENDKKTAEIYRKLVISGYYLLNAIEQCHICVNSIQTQLLQHSHNEFYNLIQDLITLNPDIVNNIPEIKKEIEKSDDEIKTKKTFKCSETVQ